MTHVRYWGISRLKMRYSLRQRELRLFRDEVRVFGLLRAIKNKHISNRYIKSLKAKRACI